MTRNLKPEERLLLGLAGDVETSELLGFLEDKDFDQGRALTLGLRHRLLPLLWDFLQNQERKSTFRRFIVRFLERYSRSVRQAQQSLYLESLRLHRDLRTERIPHVFLKGLYLSRCIHTSPGLREMDDIDLFVPLSATDQAGAVLRACGYEPVPRQGPLDQEMRFCRLFNNCFPEFVRPNNESGEPPLFRVDMAFGLVERKWDRKLAFTDGLVAKYGERDSEDLPFLSSEDNALHLFLQLASDFGNTHLKACDMHLVLLHIRDLVLLIKMDLDWQGILSSAEAYSLGEQLNLAFLILESVAPGRLPGPAAVRIGHGEPVRLLGDLSGELFD